MVESIADIVNLALVRIGERKFISDLADNAQPAIVARTVWPQILDEVLEAHDWPFARRRASPAAIASFDASDYWDYAYARPTDCVKIRRIEAGRGLTPAQQTPYVEESDATRGRILLTDSDAPQVVYTHRIADVAQYPAHFVKALAARLAPDLCSGLSVKLDLIPTLEREYLVKLGDAMAAAAGDEQEETSSDFMPDSITARR